MTQVTMLIPSRARPDSVDRQADAWRATDPLNEAMLVWVLDEDDPAADAYRFKLAQYPWMHSIWLRQWMPMVKKLNLVAPGIATDVVGFMGDDHLPRTSGWAAALAAAHILHAPGIFYGRDGLQDMKLPTWWAMSAEICRRLNRMVPADVDHLYCDNSILELGKAARCIRYLPSILIEHMHPVAEKAEWDQGYRRVNDPSQYESDRKAFLYWLRSNRIHQAREIETLRWPK